MVDMEESNLRIWESRDRIRFYLVCVEVEDGKLSDIAVLVDICISGGSSCSEVENDW